MLVVLAETLWCLCPGCRCGCAAGRGWCGSAVLHQRSPACHQGRVASGSRFNASLGFGPLERVVHLATALRRATSILPVSWCSGAEAENNLNDLTVIALPCFIPVCLRSPTRLTSFERTTPRCSARTTPQLPKKCSLSRRTVGDTSDLTLYRLRPSALTATRGRFVTSTVVSSSDP
jgi:hypothetical protein